MSTTRFLATALPYSLDPDAPWHCSVFFTHRLEPESAGATLGDFLDAADWVTTLLKGELVLVSDTAPDGIPVQVVSTPDQAHWAAVFPRTTPVAGFATPPVTGADWTTYPAHSLEGHAVDAHLGSSVASPLTKPPVLGNPVAEVVLDQLAPMQESVGRLRNEAVEQYQQRGAVNLARQVQESVATLGSVGRKQVGIAGTREDYPSEPNPWTSAVEVVLRDTEGEAATTRRLDQLLRRGTDPGTEPGATGIDPALRTLVDAHATRRFYQREETAYQERPDDGASPPRPEVPEQDFHARAGSLGSTPTLLRAVGLVVDVLVPDKKHRVLLAKASWVSARFTPAEGAEDVVRLAPPRTHCESDGKTHWRPVSAGTFSGGALPLGQPRTYTVLDLDPDASGLKLETHLRNLPRALATELNGDPSDAAPGSLRSTGFSIARVGRDEQVLAQVTRAEGFQAVPDDGTAVGPDLAYEDVVRGIRLEVWDDRSSRWHSVHERLVDVVAGGERVLKQVPDTGFVQFTGLTRTPGEDTAYHLHEVFLGWDGWSLSAPRPGKLIVHGENGEELILDDVPDPPAGHVHIRSTVAPGTLPRLRYGYRYSFRVRGVDLAGNSVVRPARAGTTRAQVRAARARIEELRGTYAEREQAGLLGAVKERLVERLPARDEDEPILRTLVESVGREGAELAEQLDAVYREAYVRTDQEIPLPRLARTGDAEIKRLLRSRLAGRAARERRAAGAGLRHSVALALGEVLRGADTWRVRPQLDVEPEVLAGLDDTTDPVRSRREFPGWTGPVVEPEPPDIPVVTTPRPFLRWHPVPPPTLVARAPLGTGETLQRLVIRGTAGSERHVAPPKGTQLEAEQHGMFDEAVGSTDQAVHDRLLAVALRERGTFLDEVIPDLEDATAAEVQPGIALHARPGADPDAMVTLADITAHRDTPLGEGQYVVHDTDQLVLPYLPDVLAHGVSLVFYDAGAPHTLAEPRVLQTVVLEYAGQWPAVEPLRLVAAPGEELGASREGNVVTVTVPAGEQVRVAMSSAMDEEALQVLGLWRQHVASVAAGSGSLEAARAVLARAAANGWFWWLTPSHDLRLVHAVPRPVRPPELPALKVWIRPAGLTVAALLGVVDVHGPSTERITLEARWSEWVDDLAADGPERVQRQDVVTSSAVQPDERFGLLHVVDAVLPGQDGGPPVVAHKAIQNFPDTHHRRVSYAARGVTRYAEFFEPGELPVADDPTLLGEARELSLDSTARPAAPEVSDVIPLLLWEQETEPDQPFALRRTRRSGARVWLERPWFSSGDGELLAVVLGTTSDPPSLTSRWAKDPVQLTGLPPSTALLPLVRPAELLVDLAAGTVVDPQPGRPVTTPVTTRLVDAQGRPSVVVLGYQPEYHPGRKQWFVDIAMDPGDSLWPFVRLAVARYQPHSLPDCDLSTVALTEWVQPLPERVATANRRSEDTVRLTVTGPAALARFPREPDGEGEGPHPQADAVMRQSRELYATVQEAPADGAGGDLDWTDRGRVRLPLVGLSGLQATWSAEAPLPKPLPLATPGGSTRYRVLVEEFEYFDADPDTGPKEGLPGRAQRLVYADHFPL